MSLLVSSAALRALGVKPLVSANDPATRARIDGRRRREAEAVRRWLARLANHYGAMQEADPITPERLKRLAGRQWVAADGRYTSSKLAQMYLNLSTRQWSWWSPEIRALKRMHDIVSLALGQDTLRGLKVRDSARKGHRERYGDIDEKRREYQAKVNELAMRPDLSRKCINAIAADFFGVCSKTIERHTKNPRKRRD